jgi:hypothetical protein
VIASDDSNATGATEPNDESNDGQRGSAWRVWPAALAQGVLAAAAILFLYALYFVVIDVFESNTIDGIPYVAGLVILIGGLPAILGGLASGACAAWAITRRRATWSLRRLRWTVAGCAFAICLVALLPLFPFFLVTFPLPFVAAAIAAWRTADLASPKRAG